MGEKMVPLFPHYVLYYVSVAHELKVNMALEHVLQTHLVSNYLMIVN